MFTVYSAVNRFALQSVASNYDQFSVPTRQPEKLPKTVSRYGTSVHTPYSVIEL